MRALFFIFLLLGGMSLQAQELSIFEVRRNIPLSDEDPVYKDYYISGGSNQGLKKDLLVNIVRQVTLKDPVEGKEAPKLEVPIGRLRLIYVDENVAVARLFENSNRDFLPMIEQPGFMIGDRVLIKNAKVETTPYKFIEDTARIRPERLKFSITGQIVQVSPTPLLPDIEIIPQSVAIITKETAILPAEELANNVISAGPKETIQ